MCHLVDGHLKDSLPTDISSVYHWYSKRLETELKTKLQIKEQHFLYLLSAITASRESLPVGFVSKVLVPGTNSSTAKRKVRRALGSLYTQLGGILAGFKCSFYVVCLDVFQQLDYMVCECTKGMLQLWSLFTGRLVWTRPVVIEKSYNMDSLLPSRCFNARWLNSWLEKRKG